LSPQSVITPTHRASNEYNVNLDADICQNSAASRQQFLDHPRNDHAFAILGDEDARIVTLLLLSVTRISRRLFVRRPHLERCAAFYLTFAFCLPHAYRMDFQPL
jgi:hypothetical protein